jgi:uncharacterized protein YjbI with pentapeptide repeats
MVNSDQEQRLQGADLSGANLQMAYLRNIRLRYAIYQGSNVDGTDFRGAREMSKTARHSKASLKKVKRWPWERLFGG